ncbi:MAG: nicotinate-nucleotide adenylyltransferase [Candidatus Aegiribacteria sp.]|nr:nicotinate-nucleotide adenylyltransferase [Candidatus Aegiribacteria sp.]
MTGLLGGTFDPPHFGHLVLALEAYHRFHLENVLLVPSRFPPHKPGFRVTPFHHRFEMTKIALKDSPELSAADLEPHDKPSWTVNLLENLADEGLDICFIMGMDSLEEMHTWKDPERISERAKLVVGTRPGYEISSVDPKIRSMIETFPVPGLFISSSDLRDRFARGLNTRYLVPDSVQKYIGENELYAGRKGG